MVCLAPRAREESMRPRCLSGVVVWPLNFTVRRSLRSSKRLEEVRLSPSLKFRGGTDAAGLAGSAAGLLDACVHLCIHSTPWMGMSGIRPRPRRISPSTGFTLRTPRYHSRRRGLSRCPTHRQ